MTCHQRSCFVFPSPTQLTKCVPTMAKKFKLMVCRLTKETALHHSHQESPEGAGRLSPSQVQQVDSLMGQRSPKPSRPGPGVHTSPVLSRAPVQRSSAPSRGTRVSPSHTGQRRAVPSVGNSPNSSLLTTVIGEGQTSTARHVMAEQVHQTRLAPRDEEPVHIQPTKTAQQAHSTNANGSYVR